MSDNSNTNSDLNKVTEAIVKHATSGVQSISVDGMSASYQSLDQQLKALSALQKQQASKNPLAAIKIFKVKSGN